MASVTATRYVEVPRAFLRVAGPDAADLLQRLLSNDVEALPLGGSCDALLLTPKARVIAPVRVHRRGDEDFLLSTESTLGEPLRANLVRARLRSRAEIEPEEHRAFVVLGGTEVIDEPPVGAEISAEEWELHRIESAVSVWGAEIDDRILPAEAGLEHTHVSFTKGCYPGQEPVARLHYRGHPNRTLRRLELEGDELPAYDSELTHEGKVVGRITSSARRPDGVIAALGYVRADVPDDADLRAGELRVRLLG